MFRCRYSNFVSPADPVRDLPVSVPQERGDAARNRVLLLDAARRLIDERGADAVTMDDIAGAAVFLAGKAGGWMTGQTMVVDGGSTS